MKGDPPEGFKICPECEGTGLIPKESEGRTDISKTEKVSKDKG